MLIKGRGRGRGREGNGWILAEMGGDEERDRVTVSEPLEVLRVRQASTPRLIAS